MIPAHELLDYRNKTHWQLYMDVTKFINRQIYEMLEYFDVLAIDSGDESQLYEFMPQGCFRDPNFSVRRKIDEIYTILLDDILRIDNLALSPVNKYIIYQILDTYIEIWKDEDKIPPDIPSDLKKRIEECPDFIQVRDVKEGGGTYNVVLECIQDYNSYLEFMFLDWDFKTSFVNYQFAAHLQYGSNRLIRDEELEDFLPIVSDDLYEKYMEEQKCDKDEIPKELKLVEDFIQAGLVMQSNYLYWNCSENDRNTYIRDYMRAKGYIVADQTLSGVSGSGKNAGELDLQIFRNTDEPWSVYEGVNLTGCNSTMIKYWNCHLEKLLDNYNPLGYPLMFLVSFLKCKKESFLENWKQYREHAEKYAPENYTLLESSVEQSTSLYMRRIRCLYSRGGMSTLVWHIFLRMGD